MMNMHDVFSDHIPLNAYLITINIQCLARAAFSHACLMLPWYSKLTCTCIVVCACDVVL